jgi:xylulokinase
MADVLGRTVRRMADPVNVGVRGAGLLAWLALGELEARDLEGRARAAATHEPAPEHRETYERLFEAFRALYKANRSVRGRLAAVREGEEGER